MLSSPGAPCPCLSRCPSALLQIYASFLQASPPLLRPLREIRPKFSSPHKDVKSSRPLATTMSRTVLPKLSPFTAKSVAGSVRVLEEVYRALGGVSEGVSGLTHRNSPACVLRTVCVCWPPSVGRGVSDQRADDSARKGTPRTPSVFDTDAVVTLGLDAPRFSNLALLKTKTVLFLGWKKEGCWLPATIPCWR